MTERVDYDALARAITRQIGGVNLRGISSDNGNVKVLRRLRDYDDESSPTLHLCEDGSYVTRYPSHYYLGGESTRSMGWLGYYVGNNTQLKHLIFTNQEPLGRVLDHFFEGLQRNTSIRGVEFDHSNLLDSDAFGGLGPFLANNTNLTSFRVTECYDIGPEQCRSLSLALAKGKSLTSFTFKGERRGHERQRFADEHVVDVILALSLHPHLELLQLPYLLLGRRSFVALSTLLQWRATALETLNLARTGMDNEGVQVLVNAIIARPGSLRTLSLDYNPFITVEGCQAISALVANPNCGLKYLSICNDSMDDESAALVADSLKQNCSLETLRLGGAAITKEGWRAFANALCDTSNVNGTFMSNHTLRDLSGPSSTGECRALYWELKDSLQVNSQHDTKTAAIIKILTHHDEVDVRPLFEWEFKVLPLAIQWLERTAGVFYLKRMAPGRQRKMTRPIGRWELSVIYQFVRGMPALFIEARVGGGKSK